MKKKEIIVLSFIILVCLTLFSSFCTRVYVTNNNKNAVYLEKINNLTNGYFYDEALSLLEESSLGKNKKAELTDKINTLKNNLVKYDGEVYHIFTHSLIVYPSLAFDGDYTHEGYDLWMITVTEFERIINSMYEKGYILIDIRDIYEKDENGKIIKKDIYLPEGKTPFVFSVDDICYYDYMKNDGFASRLVLDENGEVATVVKNLDGQEEITRNGDVVPIIDDFVKQHPDFSYRGAKGILAVTGYEGILGYRITDVTGEDLDEMLVSLTPVVEKLKETGWLFASHSYTHNDYFKTLKVTMEEMVSDCTRWDDLIKTVTGDTKIYISPFGYRMEQDDERYKYLINNHGFEIFCPVDGTSGTKFYDTNVIMGRYAIDGLSLRNSKEKLSKFFDCDEVIDEERNKTGLQ